MALEKYFEKPTEPLLHPDVRRFEAKLRPDAKAECHLFRERDGLVFRPARLYLYVKSGGELVDSDHAGWDPRLNDWLLSKGIRAEALDNEVKRFGLVLSDRFDPVELRYGDGFFNAVLVQHLRRTGFAALSPTRQKLERIHEPRAAHGPSANECAAMIDQVVRSCALDLVERLSYSRGEAEQVLAGALADYLDERFNITNRDLLGLG